MSNNKKLKDIFDKYNKAIDQVSKEFIEELKCDSKTYGQVYIDLNLFEKEINYNSLKSLECKFITIGYFSYIKKLLEKEKNDLLLTNRSE